MKTKATLEVTAPVQDGPTPAGSVAIPPLPGGGSWEWDGTQWVSIDPAPSAK